MDDDEFRHALLLRHGYEPDQLVRRKNGGGFCFAPADLSKSFELVQNPDGLRFNDRTKSEILEFVANGYMPHHLIVLPSGDVCLDYETIGSDRAVVAFRYK